MKNILRQIELCITSLVLGLDSHYDKKAGEYTKKKFGKYFQILNNYQKRRMTLN